MKSSLFIFIILLCILNAFAIPYCDYSHDTNGNLICNLRLEGQIISKDVELVEIYPKDALFQFASLSIKDQTMLYMPKRIQPLKHVRGLFVIRTGLVEIQSKDLEHFTSLELLQISGNRIESLEENLFQYNQKLLQIIFSENRIKLIHQNVFTTLANLKFLNLEQNLCIRDSKTTHENMNHFLEYVNEKCSRDDIIKLQIEINRLTNEVDANRKEIEKLKSEKPRMRLSIVEEIIFVIIVAVILSIVLLCCCCQGLKSKKKEEEPERPEETSMTCVADDEFCISQKDPKNDDDQNIYDEVVADKFADFERISVDNSDYAEVHIDHNDNTTLYATVDKSSKMKK